jgi:hypothetical protein
MQYQILDFLLTHLVNALTPHEFVKNLSVPRCVIVLVEGITMNVERRLAGYTKISHKSMANCGF